MKTWETLFPDGRVVFYEGGDPEGFASEMKYRFGFDPRESEYYTKARGYSFHCPGRCMNEVYGSGEYPLGS